jgi:hypothetical protein
MSENDNNGNFLQPNYYMKTQPKASTLNGNVEALKDNFMGRGILPRAKILSNSVLEASGVDYNLRTQTIGRYHPVQQATNIQLKRASQTDISALAMNNRAPSSNLPQKTAFSCHTLPVTRRENQQKEVISRLGNLNYITLENALNVKAIHQLTPTQGWAFLCQSVQALQDLFLSGESFESDFFSKDFACNYFHASLKEIKIEREGKKGNFEIAYDCRFLLTHFKRNLFFPSN